MFQEATQAAQSSDRRTAADSISSRGRDTAMPEIGTPSPMSTSIAAFEWGVQAQRIVAYPEDFGMTREQVGRLARTLAERYGSPEMDVRCNRPPGGRLTCQGTPACSETESF